MNETQPIWEGIARLDKLAQDGDKSAVEEFFKLTCVMARRLNELHVSHAEGVVEWPIVLPRDRAARREVTKRALEMRIGSVRAGGRGQPEKLDYNSEKGFALQNLERFNFARALLTGSIPSESGQIDDPDLAAAFTSVTELSSPSPSLLNSFLTVPAYAPSSRMRWIELIIEGMKENPDLIPRFLSSRRETRRTNVLPNGSKEHFTEWRGGAIRKSLVAGLKNVTAIPKRWV